MCLGNRADAAAEWVNSQIAALWNISERCVEKHGRGKQHVLPEIVHGTCLAQYGAGLRHREALAEELSFFASFAAPTVTFVCNHEVLVQFHLTGGHVKLGNDQPCLRFKDTVCAFRMPFRLHIIEDTKFSSFGGLITCKTKFFILDLDAASFVRRHSRFNFTYAKDLDYSGSEDIQQEIISSMQVYYLKALREAGFHYIQSLPDFDNLQKTHLLDFSLLCDLSFSVNSVYGIHIEAINTFLRGRWLEAAGLVDDLEDNDWSLYSQFALAEHRASCDDFHFHACFGPPRIHALCSKEIVFYLNVEDLYVYFDGEWDRKWDERISNWKIAIIVDVSFAEECDGRTRPIWLNVSTARYCEALSEFGEAVVSETLRATLVRYLTTRYLMFLEEYHHHYLYYVDFSIIPDGPEDEPLHEEYRERLRVTNMFGFDIMTALTQSSINLHFRSLWKRANAHKGKLSYWFFGEARSFHATFDAPQIQLPNNSNADSVILYLAIKDGSLTCVDHDKQLIPGATYPFTTWTVAYEVKVKCTDDTPSKDLAESCFIAIDPEARYRKHQIYLDLLDATFRQDLSRLPGLFEDANHRLMRDRRRALTWFVRQYFRELLTESEAYHVLCTIPTWHELPPQSKHYAPSTILWQFYGEPTQDGTLVHGCFTRKRNASSRNMILICQSLNPSSRPGFPISEWCWRWESCLQNFCGTVAVSRQAFLEKWLLTELLHINRRSTLIPRFECVEAGGDLRFNILISPVVSDRWQWVPKSSHDHALEFTYFNKEVWTYEHQGGSHLHNGHYSVATETQNCLFIPLVSKRGVCEIKMEGHVTLKLQFANGGVCKWETQSVADWSASIFVGSSSKPTITSSVQYRGGIGFLGDSSLVHKNVQDAQTLLKLYLKDFQSVIISDVIVKYLRSRFCDVWPMLTAGAYNYRLCNPVFNSKGDLLFDLQAPIDLQGHIPDRFRSDFYVLRASASKPMINGSDTIDKSALISDNSIQGIGINNLLKSPPEAHSTLPLPSKVVTQLTDDTLAESDEEIQLPKGKAEVVDVFNSATTVAVN